jgi:hypothetical protein
MLSVSSQENTTNCMVVQCLFSLFERNGCKMALRKHLHTKIAKNIKRGID